jgi:hypothetical protein
MADELPPAYRVREATGEVGLRLLGGLQGEGPWWRPYAYFRPDRGRKWHYDVNRRMIARVQDDLIGRGLLDG